MTAPRVYDSSLTADVPHFAPPATPSRSPFKDTLHRRSPTKQLRPGAKASINHDEYQRIVSSEISTAAEKELASRVVKAADRLKEWCREIEQWGWSGSFDKRHERRLHHDPFERIESGASLPPEVVERYDSRLDSIGEELEELEVDDLKEQILGIHLGRSRPSSSYSSASSTNVVLYDDFQLFVTEALLHALPFLAKLQHYLKIWHVRLDVYRQVPMYLDGLSFLEEILTEAWQGLKHASTPEMDEKEIEALDEQLTTAQSALKYKVSELGTQLDRMLDALEGQDDCLPDDWIDKYENNEKSYAEWSYQADRKLFQLRHTERPKPAPAAKVSALRLVEESVLSAAEAHVDAEVDMSNLSPPIDMSFASVRASTPPFEPVKEDETRNKNGERDVVFLPVIEQKRTERTGESSDGEEPVIEEAVHRPVEAVLRRASVASIESFTREQVRETFLAQDEQCSRISRSKA